MSNRPYSIEREVIKWLRDEGFDARFSVPGDAPACFVSVSRIGGGIENALDHPLVAIDVWDRSAEEASDKAVEIRHRLLQGSQPRGVRRCAALSGPLWVPDPNTRRPVYELQVEFSCGVI